MHLPAEYQLIEELTISKKNARGFAIVLILTFPVFLAVFTYIAERLFGIEIRDVIESWRDALLFVVLCLTILPFHELIHGLVYSFYGGKPRYGIGVAHTVLPFAYATVPGFFFTRSQFVQAALAPLLFITPIGFGILSIFEWGWLVVPLAANAAGAIGDMWASFQILHYPRHVLVEDTKTGMRVYGSPGDRKKSIHPGFYLLWEALVWTAVFFPLLFIVMPFVIPKDPNLESYSLGPRDSILNIIQYKKVDNGRAVSIGFGTVLLGAVPGFLVALLRARFRKERHDAS